MTETLILLTTDFSTESERAFAPTVELAKKLGGRITLLHVVEYAAVAPHGAPLAPVQVPPDLSEQLESAEETIAEWARKLGSEVPVNSEVVSSSDPVQAITDYAKDHGAGFLAISTHGRTGLRRLIMGSTTEAIVRHSHVPVICFPKQG